VEVVMKWSLEASKVRRGGNGVKPRQESGRRETGKELPVSRAGYARLKELM